MTTLNGCAHLVLITLIPIIIIFTDPISATLTLTDC